MWIISFLIYVWKFIPFHCSVTGTEKKLLQSKLRKAAASGKAIDVKKSATDKKDVSTSTEDLGKNDNFWILLPTFCISMLFLVVKLNFIAHKYWLLAHVVWVS